MTRPTHPIDVLLLAALGLSLLWACAGACQGSTVPLGPPAPRELSGVRQTFAARDGFSIHHPASAWAERLLDAAQVPTAQQGGDSGLRDAETLGRLGGCDAIHAAAPKGSPAGCYEQSQRGGVSGLFLQVARLVVRVEQVAEFRLSDLVLGDFTVRQCRQNLGLLLRLGHFRVILPGRFVCHHHPPFSRVSPRQVVASFAATDVFYTSYSSAATGYGQKKQNNSKIGENPQKTAFFCQGQESGGLAPLIALSLCLASATPAPAQEPHGGLLDGDGVIAEIRETRRELKEHREAIRESAAEAREWRGLFSRFDGSFLNRIGTLVWLTFWVLIVGGVAYCLRQVADVLKAFKSVFSKTEVKE